VNGAGAKVVINLATGLEDAERASVPTVFSHY
jgi:hypothetical protein